MKWILPWVRPVLFQNDPKPAGSPALKRQANLNGQDYTKKPPQKNRIFVVMKGGIPNHFNTIKQMLMPAQLALEWAPWARSSLTYKLSWQVNLVAKSTFLKSSFIAFPPSFLHWCYFKYKFKNMTYQIFSKMDRPAHENQATSNLLRPEMVLSSTLEGIATKPSLFPILVSSRPMPLAKFQQ